MQHLQKTGGGAVIMVNQMPETNHPSSSSALCLRASVAAASSIFRTLFQVPYAVSPLLATLTKTAGVWEYPSHFETVHAPSTFKHSDLQMFPRVSELSPFFSDSCAL